MASRQGSFEDPYCRTDDANEAQQGEFLGSSGEKSRVLLAGLPSSIGASQHNSDGMPPLAIIYDKIDAHVGGRAAVTVARLLAEQTRKQSKSGSQIIAITHNSSVAQQVRAFVVDGQDSDLALGEAEAFADALIRDATLQKEIHF
eukprot:scaffold72603_cov83-Cyclotella_meneghiniana.AAC.4